LGKSWRSFPAAKPTFEVRCDAPRAAYLSTSARAWESAADARAAAYEVALGEAKELIVALDCVEIDQLAPLNDVFAAQDLADRVAAMLTKLIRSAEAHSL
jgi:hypothetical protein